MKRRDGHTHPNLLKVPGQAEEFLRYAIERRLDEIVFTDHMPYSVTGDEGDRIPAGDVARYCREVKQLAEKYSSEIRILTGIELDFHPKHVDEVKEVISEGKFDLKLGSTHFDILGYGIPYGEMTKADFVGISFENYLRAAESGLFDVMTHLDVHRRTLLGRVGESIKDSEIVLSNYYDVLRALFAVMEKKNIALEINATPLYLGFDKLGAYPSEEIRNIASDYSIRYVYGSDAHSAFRVGFGYDEVADLLSPSV